MSVFEYRIVPAPERARKIKGAKTPEARFSATLEEELNDLAADGWEYLRTETFAVEERAGLASRKTVERQVMVFRRPIASAEPVQVEPRIAAEAEPHAAEPPADLPQAERSGSGPRILGRPLPPVTRFPKSPNRNEDPSG